MEMIRYELPEKATVHIRYTGGDLRVSGREGNAFEVQAPAHGELEGTQEKGRVEISCRSSCLIYLPQTANLHVDSIGGDGRITGVQGDLIIKMVGGDLALRRTSTCAVERVGGDLNLRHSNGPLSVDNLGGDALIEKAGGTVRLRMIGGDLRVRKMNWPVEATCGGDINLECTNLPEGKYALKAGGDIRCRVPDDSSFKAEILAGGDLRCSGVDCGDGNNHKASLLVGSRDAIMSLVSGGDINFTVGSLREEYDNSISAEIMADMEVSLAEADARIAEASAKLGAFGADLTSFDGERIGSEIRRAVSRALKHSDRAQRKRKHRSVRINLDSDLGRSIGLEKKTRDDERLTILKMVEQGTITIEEAELLLNALEEKI